MTRGKRVPGPDYALEIVRNPTTPLAAAIVGFGLLASAEAKKTLSKLRDFKLEWNPFKSMREEKESTTTTDASSSPAPPPASTSLPPPPPVDVELMEWETKLRATGLVDEEYAARTLRGIAPHTKEQAVSDARAWLLKFDAGQRDGEAVRGISDAFAAIRSVPQYDQIVQRWQINNPEAKPPPNFWIVSPQPAAPPQPAFTPTFTEPSKDDMGTDFVSTWKRGMERIKEHGWRLDRANWDFSQADDAALQLLGEGTGWLAKEAVITYLSRLPAMKYNLIAGLMRGISGGRIELGTPAEVDAVSKAWEQSIRTNRPMVDFMPEAARRGLGARSEPDSKYDVVPLGPIPIYTRKSEAQRRRETIRRYS